MQGWTKPTLQYIEREWRIYADHGQAFVPLFNASKYLLDACPGAHERLNILNDLPF